MKKLTCILAVMLMLCICTIAYAADPVTLDITALDYQTGKAVSKTYVNNELFLLKVDLGIPRFFDLTDMELIIELDGVKLEFTDDALRAIAEKTLKHDTGARGLRSVMEGAAHRPDVRGSLGLYH